MKHIKLFESNSKTPMTQEKVDQMFKDAAINGEAHAKEYYNTESMKELEWRKYTSKYYLFSYYYLYTNEDPFIETILVYDSNNKRVLNLNSNHRHVRSQMEREVKKLEDAIHRIDSTFF